MQKIYNEGRVVGLSAYELYVRHTLSEYPDNSILTEREWLAATLGNGSSMILKISAGTRAGVHDYPLPQNSLLCAANTITASLFNGTVDVSTTNNMWATKVTSYGPLVEGVSDDLDKATAHMLNDYLKITDGITNHSTKWDNSVKDFVYDLEQPSAIRLRISKDIEYDVYVLFMGLLFRPIVAGSSKLYVAGTNTENPQNGDFLGPEVFPRHNKIIFTVPSESFTALNRKYYERQLEKGQTAKYVDSKAVIDYESANLDDYYRNYPDSKISLTVTDLNVVGEGVSVLSTYQRRASYPPVLYGAKVSAEGDSTMCPVDIAPPGHVKIFRDEDLAKNYADTYPGTFAIYKDENNNIFMVNDDDSMTSVSCDVEVVDHADSTGYAMQVTAGGVSRKALSLQNKNGDNLDLYGTSSKSSTLNDHNTTVTDESWVNASSGLRWSNLLDALKNSKIIDVLGKELRTFRNNLPNIETQGVLNLTGTGENKLSGSLKVSKSINATEAISSNSTITAKGTVKSTDGTLQSSTPYIALNNGEIRLYISNTEPKDTDIPDGSIGIGWE